MSYFPLFSIIFLAILLYFFKYTFENIYHKNILKYFFSNHQKRKKDDSSRLSNHLLQHIVADFFFRSGQDLQLAFYIYQTGIVVHIALTLSLPIPPSASVGKAHLIFLHLIYTFSTTCFPFF